MVSNQIHCEFPHRLIVLAYWLLVSSFNAGAQNVPAAQNAMPKQAIDVDYSRVKGKHNTSFREVVGAGRGAP